MTKAGYSCLITTLTIEKIKTPERYIQYVWFSEIDALFFDNKITRRETHYQVTV
jgi:hypothetical protein